MALVRRLTEPQSVRRALPQPQVPPVCVEPRKHPLLQRRDTHSHTVSLVMQALLHTSTAATRLLAECTSTACRNIAYASSSPRAIRLPATSHAERSPGNGTARENMWIHITPRDYELQVEWPTHNPIHHAL